MPPFHRRVETSRTEGCSVVLRRVDGPDASELFVHGRPPPGADAAAQAEALYGAVLAALDAQGADFASVVTETVYLRSVAPDDLGPIRAARRRVLDASAAPSHRPATSEIHQPPLDDRVGLEISVQAVVPNDAPLASEAVAVETACGCAECAGLHGLRIHLGHETRLHAGGLCAPGEGAYEQALAVFEVADDLLARVGLGFGDVVRTWIHLRDIDRDYDALNRARRAFFEARGIDPAPASTGIGGGPPGARHAVCLGLHAVAATTPVERRIMTAATLNEAPQYGADFSRGMAVVESNKRALHVSGTASVDERGRTAHVGDFEAQADRMLVNIAALLERQQAGVGDVVSAVTYLKRRSDAEALRKALHEAGFEGFPHALVEAPICRPELLCETEALAILAPAAPSTGRTRRGV